MKTQDEVELYFIGTAAAVSPGDQPDTTSDHCDWVVQYTDWEEGRALAAPARAVPRRSVPIPALQSIPRVAACVP